MRSNLRTLLQLQLLAIVPVRNECLRVLDRILGKTSVSPKHVAMVKNAITETPPSNILSRLGEASTQAIQSTD
jgi:hypothetical protein